MKITICGSIAFHSEMIDVKNRLESMGHQVDLPPTEIMGEDGKMMPVKKYYEIRKKAEKDDKWVWDKKEEAMISHFMKVKWSDAILVLNCDKNNIVGYVGGNTLMEMGLAFFLGKKIYLYCQIPEISYKEEILGMKPILIDKDLYLIR